MHHLQKYILDKLRFEQPLSYTAMLPNNMVSSQFQYHLKLLQQQGFVQKNTNGAYELTHAGEATLEYMSVGRITPRRMPKVVSYTLLTHKGSALLLRKQKEPYRHLVEPVSGKIHFNEDTQTAAQREVKEKLGLTTALPHLRGVANILIRKHGEPVTHMVAYAHLLELSELPNPLPTNAVLAPLQTAAKRDDLLPGIGQLIEAITKDDKLFIITITADA